MDGALYAGCRLDCTVAPPLWRLRASLPLGTSSGYPAAAPWEQCFDTSPGAPVSRGSVARQCARWGAVLDAAGGGRPNTSGTMGRGRATSWRAAQAGRRCVGVRCEALVLHKSLIGNRLWGMVRWSWYIPYAISARIRTDLAGRSRPDRSAGEGEPLIGDGSLLEIARREIAWRCGRHNWLGFAYRWPSYAGRQISPTRILE